MKKAALQIMVLVLLTSCPSANWFRIKHITDDYVVTWGDYYDNGDIGYTLSSDLCFEKRIEDIKNVKWSHRTMLVEKNSKEQLRWYAILAKNNSIELCFGDTLIGPLSHMQVDSLLKANNISNLKEKTFIK